MQCRSIRKLSSTFTAGRATLWPRASISGFTLIEVLVVVAILAVLSALASPSFAKLIDRYRARQAAEDLTATLYLARAESVKRGGNVLIQKTACLAAPDADRWDCGWTVFHDANGNLAVDSGESIQTSPAPTNTTVQNGFPGGSHTLAIDPWGAIGGTLGSGRFVIKPANNAMADATSAITLCIGSGGRIRTVKEALACTS